MGDDTALPPLAGRARPLYAFFRQRFAQVTNPPIDHLRERFVFSLRTLLGDRSPILVEGPEAAGGHRAGELLPLPGRARPARRRAARRDVRAGRGARVPRSTASSPRPRRGPRGPGHAAALRHGRRPRPRADPDRCSPSASSTSTSSPTSCGRSRRIVVESDEPREVHHVACLLGYGAEAICPRLALETVAAHRRRRTSSAATGPRPTRRRRAYRQAVEDGVLKVMSKMGISDVASYCGAQLFDAVGLARRGGRALLRRHRLARRRPRLRRARARLARAPCAGMGGGGAPREPRLREVPQGRRAARDEPDVVEALHETAAAHALRKAVRDEDWRALRALRRARQRT